MQSNDKKSPI